jgi:uncharacterized protein (TIGR00269 family)
MTGCDRCKKRSVAFIRYSGQHLCKAHYLELISRRFSKELRKQGFRPKGKRIGLALSGGKDSVLMMNLMKEIVGPVRSAEMVALTVDEGIEGYRPSSMEIAKGISRDMGVEQDIYSFKEETGYHLDELVGRTDQGACGICGILRRRALNIMAKRNGCDLLVTGHNLDDYAQTVLMNILSADLDRMARLGPHGSVLPGFVPRLMPLRTTPENETFLAAYLLGLPIHDVECPYSTDVRRGRARDLVLAAEEVQPGARHSLLSFQDQVRPLIPVAVKGQIICASCHEPMFRADGESECKACALLKDAGVVLHDEEKVA